MFTPPRGGRGRRLRRRRDGAPLRADRRARRAVVQRAAAHRHSVAADDGVVHVAPDGNNANWVGPLGTSVGIALIVVVRGDGRRPAHRADAAGDAASRLAARHLSLGAGAARHPRRHRGADLLSRPARRPDRVLVGGAGALRLGAAVRASLHPPRLGALRPAPARGGAATSAPTATASSSTSSCRC